MDWANEEYVRVYRRDTDDDLALSWQARALWKEMLVKFDRSGLIETRRGVRGLAAVVRWPVEIVEPSIAELVSDGRVRHVPTGYFAPNFLEAQEASKSDRARQKESRQRRASTADRVVSPQIGHANTPARDETSGDAEPRDQTSQVVTLSSADPIPMLSEPPLPAESPSNSFDRMAASRRVIGGLAEATWKRLNELRLKHAERLKLAEVMPLPPVSPASEPRGFRELRQRIREEGDNARTVCDHVLRVLDQQSLEEGNIEWLDEKTFLEAPWNTSRSKAIKPKRRTPEPIPTIPLTGDRAGPEDFERARRALAGELS